MKVGIPRGLFYYYYYPLWKTFFEELGAEVISSSPTNRNIVEKGIELCVDEACFPIKVYFGHVRELCGYGLDYLFVPRMVSVEYRSYICPKFMGVPDMVKACIPNLPPLISPVVDLSKTDKTLKNEVNTIGKLFTGRSYRIKQAYAEGLKALKACEELTRTGLTRDEAIEQLEGRPLSIKMDGDLRIGVLGHGYSIYDRVISLNIINRLRDMGCQVQLAEMIDRNAVEEMAATLPKRVFWTLGRKIVGSALYMKEQANVDGIIYLACFGCGPDSLIGEIVERKLGNKPWMMLTMDEHTGEAGMVTRLEAFCDMLRRRKLVNA